ncbi:MAG: methyltransferase [Deltaproteobacteria bacterium]|nr:methyltransferase [Deltaproteobacteria bacterium]
MTSPPEPAFMELLNLARSFRPAKILMVATDLGVFDHLEEPRHAPEVAAKVEANARAVGILLNGLAAIGVVEKQGERFKNGPAASRYLVHAKEDYRGAIIRHMHHTWLGWTELGRTVATGKAPDRKSEQWLDRHPESEKSWMRDFIWGMHAIAQDLAPGVVAKFDLQGVRHLLDLGGGPATYAINFAKANPGIKATVFDLPGPVEIARENIARHGQTDRVGTLAGNFLEDDIGSGYDFIWVSQILHSHDEAQCQLIIKKCVQALAGGGRLAIQDFFLNDDGYTPVEAALFSVHMLAVTPGGRSYKHREVQEWLREAGLVEVEHFETSPQTSAVVGWKK